MKTPDRTKQITAIKGSHCVEETAVFVGGSEDDRFWVRVAVELAIDP
jgi:hypothetical protein